MIAPVKMASPAVVNSNSLFRVGELLRAKMELAKYWNAPLKKGEKIGMLTYYLDGYKVAEYELKNEKAVAKLDFSWYILDYKKCDALNCGTLARE